MILTGFLCLAGTMLIVAGATARTGRLLPGAALFTGSFMLSYGILSIGAWV